MTNQNGIRSLVRIAAAQKILYLPHALRQMSRLDRMITASEIRSVVEDGQVIEDYPEDQRGHSCLMLGYGTDNRPIHVVCSPKDGYLAVITAYIPDLRQWEIDFKTRKKP
jgi:hypothetical protein